MDNARSTIERAWEDRANLSPASAPADVRAAIEHALAGLDSGRLRVAEKSPSGWVTHQWLKMAVLLSFRIEENRLVVADVQVRTDKGVDPPIGLAHPGLVRVDDLVDEVLESVCRLLPLTGADETIAQDPGTVPGAQPAGVFDQFRVRGAQVLAPDVAHIRRELLLVQAEAVPDRLVHAVQCDHAKAAVHPDIAHAPAMSPAGSPSRASHRRSTPRSGVISSTPPMSNTTARITTMTKASDG